MQAPGLPKTEKIRIETLHALRILDTESEERFDRLTRLAKRLFQVPIAMVSLVDTDRQWFKSCLGTDITGTPRSVSFCGHAILGNGTFYIPDAKADERFFDNPQVTGEPYVRFYAGYPISAPNGEKMGTLCVVDNEPREFQDEDFKALADLAAMVEQELISVQQATLDELTGISNRRGFLLLAQYSLNMCKRNDASSCLCYLDLDKFKQINDELGHAEGDRVLQIFSDQLVYTFRDSDVVARIGGDEFVVMLTNTTKEHAEEALQRFASDLHASAEKLDLPYEIEYSQGLIEYNPESHGSIEDLMQSADELMYRDKHGQKH